MRDCLSSTTARAPANIASHPPHDDLLGAKPDNDNDIAAASVLAPFGPAAAQINAVASHGHDGGIGTLVVMLGANNALGAVVGKRVAWSGPQYQGLDRKGVYTVWNPVHFQAEYAELVRRLLPVSARRVLLVTVPHVTVAPIAHGVNPGNPGKKWREGSRYFPYYTDPWVAESDFNPDENRHITHQQARAIDSAIDQYNDTIQDHVPQSPRRRPRLAPRGRMRDPRWGCLPPLPRRSCRTRRQPRLAALSPTRPHRRSRHPLLPLGRNRTAPGSPVRPRRRPPHHRRDTASSPKPCSAS